MDTNAHKLPKSRLLAVALAVIALAVLLIPLPNTTSAQIQLETVPSLRHQPFTPQTTIVLYDGSLNAGTPNTPDKQGFSYLTNPLVGALATQTFTNGVTTLDTTPLMSDYAGYFAKTNWYPALDRQAGYQLLFTTQILTETHIDVNRAGFSVLVISQDLKGIELGFWRDEVWAQEGGTSPQLFTHAEGAAFDTTGALIPYRLTIKGEQYSLAANDATILSGSLRVYTAANLLINPYTIPNLIFLGDDTGGAQARIGLTSVSLIPPVYNVYLPLVRRD